MDPRQPRNLQHCEAQRILSGGPDPAPKQSQDALARFVAELVAIRNEFKALDMALNANRIARYESSAATKVLYAFATEGDPTLIEVAAGRFTRARSMAPNSQRRKLDPRISALLQEARNLSAAERASLARDWTKLFGRRSAPMQTAPPATPAIDPINRFRDEIELTHGILKRLSLGLERWPWASSADDPRRVRWPISNEDHVQSLLWTALAPAVPGLKYEETLPSVGRLHPRVDLALPSSELVIEAKFIRRAADFARVTEEIAADASLYTAVRAATYSRMLVFVWDDSRSSERHLQLVEGLREFRGVLDVIVVSRPARMTT